MRDKLLFAFIMVALAGGSPSFQAGVGPSLDHEDEEATLPVTLWTPPRLLRLPSSLWLWRISNKIFN